MSAVNPSDLVSLKPAFFIHLDLAEPDAVVNNAKGTETVVMVDGGYAKSVDPETYPLDLEITKGWDILRTFADKPEVTNLDCDLWGKSKSNGAGVHIWYDGVVVMNEKALAVIQGGAKGFDHREAYITNHPSFQFGEGAVEATWAKGKNFLGRGIFIRDDAGKLGIEYYVYVLE
ncbi:DUF3237 domain-containing protein CYBJADRAFT_174560 [Cyberlindnera jadinii NRRL Y-1542]|uniref:Uncharacterized protein n=2 Tax=Cyberlindnera jadinii (strain ATCC 18201 / CBS 1600 / BCRC 20928 / JCM 3617 / NBRC 0987 / NRRL Y-1542) TaxID=983966 RepID=A0A1E4RXB4_CYBJN|nr:hypothetical protein CYBJADRAFT_174560 [Cyberlindnera jadinii NRRL Y-1542]ODV71904.1 hypothetical protein CYBJADRAFT_174560 [Cyberlindnera jadinii NRRL Y-1542]